MRTTISSLGLTIVLLASLSAICAAQTSYSGTVPKVCDMESVYPIQHASQFQCRGISLATEIGGPVEGSFFLFQGSVQPWVEVTVPGLNVTPGEYFDNLATVTSFTLPDPNNWVSGELPTPTTPGTISWTWQELNSVDGKVWTGTAQATWMSWHICGGRGCQYWAPKLLSFSVTVNPPAE
jgi:hypothetical protein